MLGWFKKKRPPEPASVRHQSIGELNCRSPVLLLADPAFGTSPIRIEEVSVGRHTIYASIIRYPEGGERVAKIAIRFGPGETGEVRSLGRIGVDSGMVIAIDEATYQSHWKEIGSERIGRTATPNEHRRVAKLIGEKFGLKWHEVDYLHSVFEEPISEELETRIEAFLKTFPKYAAFPFVYFRIETRNSLHRVSEALLKKLWSEVVLDAADGAHLLAVSSGFGDGSYPVTGLYSDKALIAVEVECIGPEQDEILEVFPALKY